MRKVFLLFICLCFASMARAQTGTIVLSVTASPTPIIVNQNCNYVVIQENSANPSNSFTITLPGQTTGITYPAGAKFIFTANSNGYINGQLLGNITVGSGTVQFIGIESIAAPTLPASVKGGGTGGGLTFVSSLPALCTPGVTPSVQLAVSPYTIYYCSATNTWTQVASGGGAPPGGTIDQAQFNNGAGGFSGAPGIITNSGGTNLSIKGPIPWRDITAYMPPGGCDNSAYSGGQSQGTISATSTSLTGVFGTMPQNGCGIFIAGAGPLSTLSTPSQGAAPNPNVIGTAGSTTIHYKVAAIDVNYGTSAASAAITVTTAPSTRTPTNYVGIYWTSVANAVGYLVYTDQNGGGTYVPLNYAFQCAGYTAGNVCGIIDKGAETNTWTSAPAIWPATPPSSVTAQALITTIVSGSGTSTMTLANAATTSVTSAFVLPDNSLAIGNAITDAGNDSGANGFSKGNVFIPQGVWLASTIPFSQTSSKNQGVKIIDSGAVFMFGLPITGSLSGAATTGQISISGNCGEHNTSDLGIPGCLFGSYAGAPSLGALFVVNGSGAHLSLDHLYLAPTQNGIVQGSQGQVTGNYLTFSYAGTNTGLMYQVDNNAFFTNFDKTNWNDGANGTSNNIQAIWFLGLTSTAHTTDFVFRDNSFVGHTIRVDNAFPSGGGPFGNIIFDGMNTIEGNYDFGFINMATNNGPSSVEIDNVQTGDANVAQYLYYGYNNAIGPQTSFIHGQTYNFSKLVETAVVGTPVACRNMIYDNPNQGGSGNNSIGFWGNLFGSYNGCDIGITTLGYELQTTDILTSGGNDGSNSSSAGEQMIGHVFRRPTVTTSAGSGSLSAGTYYLRVTVFDVAGRPSASSREVSQVVGASGSVVVTAVTATYFPTSCNVYFGTSAGGEANYFNSTSITNGTCSFTLTTTSGETAGTPPPVGNAMNTWLTEENNANSCLFCGSSNGGTGGLGINLTSSQYTTMGSVGGPGLFVGGLGYFFGHMQAPALTTTGTIAAALCQDASGNIINSASANCFAATGSGVTLETNGTNNSSQSILNLINSAAFNGLTATFTNTTGGTVQAGFSGTLGNGGLTNAATTVNSQTCTLGSTCTIPFQTNTTNNTSQAGVNFLTSTANAVGLTVTPTNSATNAMKFEVTGTAFTGTAANLAGCTGTAAGDICIYNGSAWARLAGNTGSTGWLQETSSGVGSWTVPSGSIVSASQYSTAIYTAAGTSNSIGGVAAPVVPNGVPQTWIEVPSAGAATQEVFSLAGVPVNNNGESTCATQTLNVLDRATAVFCSGTSTSTFTFPVHTTTGFAFNFPLIIANNNSGTMTLTPTTDTIDNGSLLANWADFVYNNAAGNWQTVQVPQFAAFGSTCTNGLTWSTSTGIGCLSNPNGTVTSFSAGNLSPLFTTSVATATTTPALTFSLSNAAAGTVFGNATGSAAGPTYTATPVLGVSGTAGTLSLFPASGNFKTILGSAATATNTVDFFATVPTTTDLIECITSSTTCTLTDSGIPITSSTIPIANVGSSGLSGTSPISITSAGAISVAGAAGEILAGATPALTYTPTLGVSGTAGTLSMFPASGNFTTTWGSGATASNTILGFAAVPVNTDIVICSVSSTTCTLTDSGIAVTSNKIAISAVGTSGLSGTSPVTISSAGAIGCATCATGPGSSTSTDLASFNGTGGLALQDSGVASGNVVTAASASGAAKEICIASGASKTCSYIDFPDVKDFPAANCNNATAGPGWSIGSGGTVTCRAGTNNLGGFIAITDTSSTFATLQIAIPEDWDTGTNPYIRFQISSTDATNNDTIIPEINVACYKGDGSTTDDVAPNGVHSLSTITLNGNANRFWSTSNVQMNSTDVTGCVAGALMQITVGRATDTATNARFWSATITWPRLLTVQAN